MVEKCETCNFFKAGLCKNPKSPVMGFRTAPYGRCLEWAAISTACGSATGNIELRRAQPVQEPVQEPEKPKGKKRGK